MPISIVDSSSFTGAGASEYNFHPGAPGGSNRLIVVGVSWNSVLAQSVVSIRYDPDGLNVLFTLGVTNSNSAIYYLIAPAIISTPVVRVRMSSLVSISGGGMFLRGVQQETPMLASTHPSGTSTGPSSSIATVSGGFVFNNLAVKQSNPDFASVTFNQLFGPYWNQNAGISPLGITGASAASPTDGSDITFSWTLGSSLNWQMLLALFAPAPSAVGTPNCCLTGIG